MNDVRSTCAKCGHSLGMLVCHARSGAYHPQCAPDADPPEASIEEAARIAASVAYDRGREDERRDILRWIGLFSSSEADRLFGGIEEGRYRRVR